MKKGRGRVRFRSEKELQMHVVWRGMKKRCYETTSPSYKYYGAKGITVCERWMIFDNFYADMKEGYVKGLKLDRLNNDMQYKKEHCRWVTAKESARNRSNNFILTIGNESKTLAEWGEIKKIKPDTINGRIRRGWSVEDAVNKKLMPTIHTGETNGMAKLTAEKVQQIRSSNKKYAALSLEFGVSVSQIGLIKRGVAWT